MQKDLFSSIFESKNGQSTIVDSAISATNACSAAYGSVSYNLGLQDGIKLMSELNSI